MIMDPTTKGSERLDLARQPLRRSPGNRPLNKSRRLSVTFTEDAYGVLEELANRRGKSLTSILQDAITLEKWAVDAIDQGATIVLRLPNGQEREILLR